MRASRVKSRASSGRRGELTIVGLGIKGLSQITAEALIAIQRATVVLHAAADDHTAKWIGAHAKRSVDLTTLFHAKRSYRAAHDKMVEAILYELQRGETLCVAFYGSAAVGVYPSHRAVELARQRGFAATMLPGISADACMLADLPLDPLEAGYQAYDATDFIRRRRVVDRTAPLVLWQIGLVDGGPEVESHKRTLALIKRRLVRLFGPRHRVALYVAARSPSAQCVIEWRAVQRFDSGHIGDDATLFVPALQTPRSTAKQALLRRRSSAVADDVGSSFVKDSK